MMMESEIRTGYEEIERLGDFAAGDAAAREELIRRLRNDAAPEFRIRACGAIASAAKYHRDALGALVGALHDEHFAVRRAACWSLEDTGLVRTDSLVRAAISELVTDRSPEVREAVDIVMQCSA